MTPWAAVCGRTLMAVLFLASGAGKAAHFAATCDLLDKRGLPLAAALAGLATSIEVLGGACLVLGLRTRLAAMLLAAYLVPVTAVFHWGPEQGVQLLKNLAIIGGLLTLVAHGPGEMSLDYRAKEKNDPRLKR